MRRFDVVIVGGGPSGAMAARHLAHTGARVAIVDGSHPREKPCGGGLTGRALELIASGMPGGLSIETVAFESGGRVARVSLPEATYLRVYSRAVLDSALLRDAQDAGADLIPARVTGFVRHGTKWTIQGPPGGLEASWLLGADGASGVVRKRVFTPFGRSQISIAAGSYVDDVATREIAIAFIDTPRGYLWSFPRDGHLAVGTCAQADETTPEEMHRVTDAWLDRYAPAHARPRRRYAWPIPSLTASAIDREQPSGDGWMLLGDAAGLVDPITREGIFFALRSGVLAAEALSTSSPATSYAERVRDELHTELRRAARLKAGFYRPRFTRLLIEALEQSPAIREVMIDLVAGRQPYRGLKRRLLGTMELGLMMRLMIGAPKALTSRH
jgi:geranylgeranyl reductase family protein